MLKKILTIAVLLFLVVRVSGQEENFISMYLLNFIRYIEWPEEKRTGDFVIEVLGHESVYEKLKEDVKGKKVGNQPIRVSNYFDSEEVGEPHVMFVGHWQSRQMQEVIRKLEGKAALIVAEKSGMLAEGAAINFLVLDGKIEYEYKKANALERGLNVSSRLWQMGIASD
jgi:hypothetical protein